MGLITTTQLTDGSVHTAADHNNPLNTIVNDYNGNITNANISASAAIATSKLAGDNGITASMIGNAAITLGYAQITAGVATSSTTIVAVTGLSVTVTIPAGTRKIRITGWGGAFTAGSTTTPSLYICDGTVATVLAYNSASIGGAGYTVPAHAISVVTPAAGSKTYLLGHSNTAGVSTTLNAAANQPAFILVEAI